MRIGVLGTGMVGRAVGGRLVELGHDVGLGSRRADHPAALEWVAAASGPGAASTGTFADVVHGAGLVVNATAGAHSLGALGSVDPADLDGVVLLDIGNALVFGEEGEMPSVVGIGVDSLAERIQRAHPGTRVVKSLSHVNAAVMADPSLVPGPTVVFLSGDDAAAKDVVRDLLLEIGWAADQVMDLGGLATARAVEAYMPLWLTIWQRLGTSVFNLQVQVGG